MNAIPGSSVPEGVPGGVQQTQMCIGVDTHQAQAPRSYAIGVVDHKKSPVVKVSVVTWDQLAERLKKPTVGEDKDVRGWVPAEIPLGKRNTDNVKTVSFLVLDIEAEKFVNKDTNEVTYGPEPPKVEDICFELELRLMRTIVHTSFSHGIEGRSRYRIVFDVSRPLAKGEVKPLGQYVVAMLGLDHAYDHGALEPSRFFYLPRVPEARKGLFISVDIPGDPLDVDALLAQATQASAPLPKAATKQVGSVIDAFNAEYAIGTILERNGYVPIGKRWMHPQSSTKMPGVFLATDKGKTPAVFSHHGSYDPLSTQHFSDGKPKPHTAFNCYCLLEHNGDVRTAVKAAAKLLGMDRKATNSGNAAPITQMSKAPAAVAEQMDGGAVVVTPDTKYGEKSASVEFARRNVERFRYVPEWHEWLEWDGTRWRRDVAGRATLASKALCGEIADAAHSDQFIFGDKPDKRAREALQFERKRYIDAVRDLARSEPPLIAYSNTLDRDVFLLNTPAGVIDLRTNTIRQHDRGDMITMITNVSPDAGSRPVFDKFLDDITCGDKDLSAYLQRGLGACLSGAISDHWLMFWYGATGRNGKNTLGDLVLWILGEYAKKVPASTLMSDKHANRHPTEIANLRGLRLAFSSEIEEGDHWHESRLKEVTGDAMLSGRFMRQDLIEFPRTHKHVVFGNNRPMLRVVDQAIASRMHMVPFNAQFTKEAGNLDTEMPEKLKAEAAQVLAWLIQGHAKWLADKTLVKCAAVEDATRDYLQAQSTLDMWIEERCALVKDDQRNAAYWPKAKDLYSDFSMWKQDRGEVPMSQSRWGEQMQRRFKRCKSDGVRYIGIELKPSPPAEDQRPW